MPTDSPCQNQAPRMDCGETRWCQLRLKGQGLYPLLPPFTQGVGAEPVAGRWHRPRKWHHDEQQSKVGRNLPPQANARPKEHPLGNKWGHSELMALELHGLERRGAPMSCKPHLRPSLGSENTSSSISLSPDSEHVGVGWPERLHLFE